MNSHRQILRSSSIIGGAAAINVAIGVLGTKAVALLLGPSGVGLLGLLQNLVGVVATIAALGVATVATRQIAAAAASGDNAALRRTRQALAWGTGILSIVGALCFWLLRDLFAESVLQRPDLQGQLACLSVAVALTVAGSSQNAVLNGLRRLGDLARVSITSAGGATLLGIAALALWKDDGLALFVLAGPACTFAVGHWFISRLGGPAGPAPGLGAVARECKSMVRVGAAFMLSGVLASLAQLAVRTMVQRQLGPGALGLFQAAATISMTYVGFVLSAMGADYYPRLAGVIEQRAAASRLVNEQSEVALLLAGPAFLIVLGFAPEIASLLYTDSFVGAASVLRWQVLGDVLKVASWPIGFVFLAAGNGRVFLLTETVALGTYAVVTWLALPLLGVEAAGVAFLAMYAAYLPITYKLARDMIGFQLERRNLLLLGAVAAAACCVMLVAQYSATSAAWLASFAGLALAVHGIRRLAMLTDSGGHAGKVLARSIAAFAGLKKWW